MQVRRCAGLEGGGRKVFGGEHRHAIHRVGQPDAAVDGPVAQLAVHRFAQHHGAGTAVAFAAALFGRGEVQVLAQHLQQGAVGCYIAHRHGLAAPDKSQGLCGVSGNHARQHSAHPMAQHMLSHMARMPKQPFKRIASGYEIRVHVRQD
ncbi:hypothetical protein D9M69_527160 [compost metagenome]